MSAILNKKVYLPVLFFILSFAALQFPATQLAGSKATFSAFDSFAPISGAFIGSWPGIIAVFAAQIANFFVHGSGSVDFGFVIRLAPTLFAVWYFSSKSKTNLVIPLLAILAFNLNPVGRSVWYYSLFWLIPVVCYFLKEKFLAARALGATFTAHAVGGALWIYFFHLPKEVWISLIPVVAVERIVFAAGIYVAYLAFNAVLNERFIYSWRKIQSS